MKICKHLGISHRSINPWSSNEDCPVVKIVVFGRKRCTFDSPRQPPTRSYTKQKIRRNTININSSGSCGSTSTDERSAYRAYEYGHDMCQSTICIVHMTCYICRQMTAHSSTFTYPPPSH